METKKVPHHLAVIPDGNRRWSKQEGLPLSKGYRHGGENFRKVMRASFKRGVKYFTIWGASEDNLRKRSRTEIMILSSLLKEEFEKLISSEEIVKEKIRVRIVGKGIEILKDKRMRSLADAIEKKTKSFSQHHFTLLFGYDGRVEMLEAIEAMRKNKSEKINYESVKRHMMTSELPPVDLVIRTGGEPHWSSGFLMWLTGDSELYFTETYWPGFDAKELDRAFADFAGRRTLKGK